MDPRVAVVTGGGTGNVSSVAAFTGRGGVYTAAKAGVAGLTSWLALDLGPQGITVNAVAPGFVEDTGFFGGNGGWLFGR